MPDQVTFKDLNPVMQGMLVVLSMVAIIVPCVLGFVNFDKRLDVVEAGQRKHLEQDEKRYDRVTEDIDDLEDSVHALELVDKGLTIQYAEILRQLQKTEEAQKIRDKEIFDFIRSYDYQDPVKPKGG